jgi:acyl dehydratase
MSAAVFASPRDLLGAEGTKLGPTDWLTIEQDRIDLFARATDDHQWIHVDPARAADGPFGTTIAHGYLTLSLVNHFLPALIDIRRVGMGVNVGTDRTRFISPVRCGDRIRAEAEIVSAGEAGGGIQSVVRVTIAIDGADKPALIVDTISRYYPEANA